MSAPKNKVVNGVTFYPAAWENKTEAEFVEHEKHHMSEEALKAAYAHFTKKAEDAPAKTKKISN